jgi:hypothetical protein
MFQYVYVSSAVRIFFDEDLRDLLEVSRRKNLERNVTGLLLYISGNFIQLLEGRREDVLGTRDRIAEDQRHRGMITLLEDSVPGRDFPEWSMGFESPGRRDASDLPGWSDFLKCGPHPAALHSSALKLLNFFRELNATRPRT